MELGETLTITSALSTTAYVALRARTKSEVTIRIAPPLLSSNLSSASSSPRGNKVQPTRPQPNNNTNTNKSFINNNKTNINNDNNNKDIHSLSTTTTTAKDINSISTTDKSTLKGWVMLSTPPSWNIAWVHATALPTPRLSFIMESQVITQPSSINPSSLEEIESIVENGTMNNAKMIHNKEQPVKFEIKTKNNTYKIVTNSFMTSGMRNLMNVMPKSQSVTQSSSVNSSSPRGPISIDLTVPPTYKEVTTRPPSRSSSTNISSLSSLPKTTSLSTSTSTSSISSSSIYTKTQPANTPTKLVPPNNNNTNINNSNKVTTSSPSPSKSNNNDNNNNNKKNTLTRNASKVLLNNTTNTIGKRMSLMNMRSFSVDTINLGMMNNNNNNSNNNNNNNKLPNHNNNSNNNHLPSRPQLRPVSMNMQEQTVKKNKDVPKPKDEGQVERKKSRGSGIEKKMPIIVKSIASILADCEKTLRSLDDDSSFSDAGSDFSEGQSDAETNTIHHHHNNNINNTINKNRYINNNINDNMNKKASIIFEELDKVDLEKCVANLDFMTTTDVADEVLDLCERTKGLSPVLEYVITPGEDNNNNYNNNYDNNNNYSNKYTTYDETSDSDDSSCFSEDMSETMSTRDDGASTACFDDEDDFNSLTIPENGKGYRCLQKAIKAAREQEKERENKLKMNQQNNNINNMNMNNNINQLKQSDRTNNRLSAKMEKLEKRKKKKEMKKAARESKKIEKRQMEEKRKSVTIPEGGEGRFSSLRGGVRKLFERIGIIDHAAFQ